MLTSPPFVTLFISCAQFQVVNITRCRHQSHITTHTHTHTKLQFRHKTYISIGPISCNGVWVTPLLAGIWRIFLNDLAKEPRKLGARNLRKFAVVEQIVAISSFNQREHTVGTFTAQDRDICWAALAFAILSVLESVGIDSISGSNQNMLHTVHIVKSIIVLAA